jgi:parvulin-like peptidyl-prolyl isomerase
LKDTEKLFKGATAFKRGLIFLIALTFLGCGSEATSSRDAVARVNGQAISRGELQKALAPREASLDEELLAKPGVKEALARQVLDELITRRLLMQEAARRGVFVSGEAIEGRIAGLSEGYSPQEFEAMLKERGLSLDSFRAGLAEDLAIEALLEEALGEAEEPDPQVLEAYYREHVQELHLPLRARALHIMVASAEEADRLRQEILNGADFAEMAGRHSLGPEAGKEGELGWRSPGEMPEAFDEAIFSLKPGQISPVVSSPYGYHLFKLLEVKESGVLSLEEARAGIAAGLKAQDRDVRYRQWLETLRAKADVVMTLSREEAGR